MMSSCTAYRRDLFGAISLGRAMGQDGKKRESSVIHRSHIEDHYHIAKSKQLAYLGQRRKVASSGGGGASVSEASLIIGIIKIPIIIVMIIIIVSMLANSRLLLVVFKWFKIILKIVGSEEPRRRLRRPEISIMISPRGAANTVARRNHAMICMIFVAL